MSPPHAVVASGCTWVDDRWTVFVPLSTGPSLSRSMYVANRTAIILRSSRRHFESEHGSTTNARRKSTGRNSRNTAAVVAPGAVFELLFFGVGVECSFPGADVDSIFKSCHGERKHGGIPIFSDFITCQIYPMYNNYSSSRIQSNAYCLLILVMQMTAVRTTQGHAKEGKEREGTGRGGKARQARDVFSTLHTRTTLPPRWSCRRLWLARKLPRN
jgi:hypothetical protein